MTEELDKLIVKVRAAFNFFGGNPELMGFGTRDAVLAWAQLWGVSTSINRDTSRQARPNEWVWTLRDRNEVKRITPQIKEAIERTVKVTGRYGAYHNIAAGRKGWSNFLNALNQPR